MQRSNSSIFLLTHLLFSSFSTSSQMLLDLTSSSGSVYFANSAIVLTWPFNQARFIAPFGSLFRASGSTLAWINVFRSDIYQSLKYVTHARAKRLDGPIPLWRLGSAAGWNPGWRGCSPCRAVAWVFFIKLHIVWLILKNVTSAIGTDSKSDMNAALGVSSVNAQIMSWEIFFLVFSS